MQYLAPETLTLDPRNARTHSKRQIGQIARSITRFGFTNPILVDEAGVIIAGHGRRLAADQIGLEQVPVITLRGLSDIEKRALRLADNKIAANAGWDVELLRSELKSIQDIDVGFDLELTGFATGEIDVMLDPPAGADEPSPPAVADHARAQLGDVFRLGEHRLACGDARDEALVVRMLGGRAADAAFLDPPYNLPVKRFVNRKARHGEFAMASGEMSSGEFREFLAECLRSAASASREGAVHFVCMDWRGMDAVHRVGAEVYGALLNLCVWNKSNAGMGSLYRSKHELVFVFRVGDAQHFNSVELGTHGRHRTNVWNYGSVNTFQTARSAELAFHPTVKPIALVEDAIKDVTRRGDLVLDLFTGSGSTLLAAERSGRHFAGVELDPAYVDIALERWEAMTGRTAERVGGADAA
mgnify:CR=1 FL=1